MRVAHIQARDKCWRFIGFTTTVRRWHIRIKPNRLDQREGNMLRGESRVGKWCWYRGAKDLVRVDGLL